MFHIFIIKNCQSTCNNDWNQRNIASKIREKLELNDDLGKDGVDGAEQLTIANVNKANCVAECSVQSIYMGRSTITI